MTYARHTYRCPGSGARMGYPEAKVTATSDVTGKPSYARVACPICDREFTARIVRTQGGLPLGKAGLVVVPRHQTDMRDWPA